MTRLVCCCLALLCGVLPVCRAAPPALVEAVQMPAWLERGRQVEPLIPGAEIRPGDRLRTGDGARAYLKLGEGSVMKLGESAEFAFIGQQPSDGVFRAAMNVAAGAFRFTTAALQRLRRRDVSIQVGTATIGIRGTDVWGRSGKEADLVMLIEGHVSVAPAVGNSVELQQPLTVFTAEKGGPAAPLGIASEEEFRARARETEILPGDGAVRERGRWRVIVGTWPNQTGALEVRDRLRAAGFAARIQARRVRPPSRLYEVLLPGFADELDATAVAQRILARFGMDAKPAD